MARPGRRKARKSYAAPATAASFDTGQVAAPEIPTELLAAEMDRITSVWKEVLALLELRASVEDGTVENSRDAQLLTLKRMGALMQELVGWALPPNRAPADKPGLAGYRHNLAMTMLALGFSDLGNALSNLGFGVVLPLLDPPPRAVRAGGLDAWWCRIDVLVQVQFLAPLYGSERKALKAVAHHFQKSVEAIKSWKDEIPGAFKAATLERLQAADSAGQAKLIELQARSAETPAAFAERYAAGVIPFLRDRFNEIQAASSRD